jgi:hypothetical protein
MLVDLKRERAMIDAALGGRARRPWLPLLGAVVRLAGPHAELLRHSERAWASVTFSGTRHTIALSFTGEAGMAEGEAFIAALGEHEFDIARQVVIEAAVISVEHDTMPRVRLTVEAELLLLEDG